MGEFIKSSHHTPGPGGIASLDPQTVLQYLALLAMGGGRSFRACSYPPDANYTCQDNQCVVSTRGLPKAECTQICVGPTPPAPASSQGLPSSAPSGSPVGQDKDGGLPGWLLVFGAIALIGACLNYLYPLRLQMIHRPPCYHFATNLLVLTCASYAVSFRLIRVVYFRWRWLPLPQGAKEEANDWLQRRIDLHGARWRWVELRDTLVDL